MSETQKGIKEGPPIWVESTQTLEEWKANYKKYKTCILPEPPLYNPTLYKGGKWRANK